MAIFSFNGFIPVIKKSSYIHPQATIIGNVIIGEKVYIGPHATIRGDWGKIILEDGCNVQESCTIHMFPGTTTLLKKGAHIGHGAIVHGGTIGENSLIGMNAVVMDDVVVEDECIIGALSFIPARTTIPKRSLVVGNPGRVIKQVSDEMLNWKTRGTQLYQELPSECYDTLKECEPLEFEEEDRPAQEKMFETWNKLSDGPSFRQAQG